MHYPTLALVSTRAESNSSDDGEFAKLNGFNGHGPFRCAAECNKHRDCAVWTWFGTVLKEQGKDK